MDTAARRDAANQQAFLRLAEADPVIVDVVRAGDALPGMRANMVLTSGAPLPWPEYAALQRMAVIYGAIFEGLAGTIEEADAKLHAGEILVGSTHGHGCAGPHAGIHTASMPVWVVEDRVTGARGHCTFFEGGTGKRLIYGFYGEEIEQRLRFANEVVAPTIGEAIRRLGGLPLRPLIREALSLGDDGHVRSTAGTLLFTRALLPALLELARERADEVRRTIGFLEEASYTFLRPWMAADKAAVDSITGLERSSLVTAMSINCKEFAIRVSGLGEEWFRGPRPRFIGFPGAEDGPPSEDWGWWFGADSPLTECLGFGGFAGAAAFPLQSYYLRGTAAEMVERNVAMYDITVGEHPEYRIPFLDHRGVPLGIDIFKVLQTGITPVINGGIGRKDGSAFMGGALRAPIECFQAAADAYSRRYGG